MVVVEEKEDGLSAMEKGRRPDMVAAGRLPDDVVAAEE